MNTPHLLKFDPQNSIELTSPLPRRPWKSIVLLWMLAILLLTGFGWEVQASPGFNMLPNGGFEGGSGGWSMPPISGTNSFSIVNDVTNAHTGNWVGKAITTGSYTSLQALPLDVWPSTAYVSTIWVKGSGKVKLYATSITSGGTFTDITSTTVTATSTWQKFSLNWTTFSTTQKVVFKIVDAFSSATIYVDDCETALANAPDIHFDPANPGASGFNLAFSDEFDSAGTIDSGHTGGNGYKWYVGQYYDSTKLTVPGMYSVSGGVLSILGCPWAWGSTLNTSEPDATNGHGFHGTVFSSGSGTYFEARIQMVNMSTIDKDSSHKLCPAFWSNDIKGCTGLNWEMPGNPGHMESIEDDFMEFDPHWETGTNGYYSTLHDAYNTLPEVPGTRQQISNANSKLFLTMGGIDFTQWHTYGVLWAPATAANGWIGYRQAFFDGVPQVANYWKGNQTGTYPPSGSYLFSLINTDQFDLILGSSQGGTVTMNVDYVRVYAVDSASSVTVVPNGTSIAGIPQLSQGSAVSSVKLNITITDSTPGATIYYTTDGSVPTTASSSIVSGSSVFISQSGTLNAKAQAPGYALSPMASGTYQIIGAMACGDAYTIAVQSSGTTWGWGANGNNQLGDNTWTQRNSPVQVVTGSNGLVPAAGNLTSYLVKGDGSLWAWGDNYFGTIGDGTTTARKIPKQITSLSGMIDIAAGQVHAVALKSDGTVWTWGYNSNGQLGTSGTTQSLVPVQVPGLSNVVAVAAGGNHSVALKDDGTVWAWGSNFKGEVGDGTTTQRTSPVQVSGSLSNVTGIAAGNNHTMALKNDGTVWAWGLNTSGQLGDGTTSQRNSPVQITSLSNVASIASGATAFHSAAVKNDGTLWMWGLNSSGQLGNGGTAQSATPVQVTALTNVVQVAVGGGHTVASKSDGSVWSWGLNSSGQLGNNTVTSSTTPVQVYNGFDLAMLRDLYHAWGLDRLLAILNAHSGDPHSPLNIKTKEPVAIHDKSNI